MSTEAVQHSLSLFHATLAPTQTIPLWSIGVSVVLALSMILVVAAGLALAILKRRIDFYLVLYALFHAIAITLAIATQGDVITILFLIPALWMLHRAVELLMPPEFNPQRASIPLLIDAVTVSIVLICAIVLQSPAWLLSVSLIVHGFSITVKGYTASNTHTQGALFTYGCGVIVIQLVALFVLMAGLNHLLWLSYTLTGAVMLVSVGYARLTNLFEASIMVTQAETALAKDNHHLYRMQLRNGVNQILASASHKLGTPFTVLSGMKFRIERQCTPEIAQELNQDIDASLKSISETKDLLKQLEQTIAEPEATVEDFDGLIRHVLELFHHSLSGIRLFTEVNVKNHPRIKRAEFAQLLSVILGLHVSLIQTVVGSTGEYLKITLNATASSLVLSVRQRDHGVPPDHQAIESANQLAASLAIHCTLLESDNGVCETTLHFPI